MRDHRVVMRVGVFRDVEILLQLAPGVREKRPVRADAGAELVRLEQVVGRDGHETAVAHLHLAVELQQPLVLPSFLGTETSAGEHKDERIASLQLRERPVLAAVVRKLVVGKDRAWDDVGPHRRALSMWTAASLAASSEVLPRSARDNIGGVPIGPVVFRCGRFVVAVVFLRLAQKLRQSRDVIAESSSRKPRLDLLEHPAIAIGVAERGERAVAGMIGRRPADSTACAVALELSSGRPSVEHLADLDTAGRRARRAQRQYRGRSRYMPSAEPGVAEVIIAPNWIEHPSLAA